MNLPLWCGFKKEKILFICFREGKGEEREGEKHQCVVTSHAPPTGDLARNQDMCPDWELNRQPFGLQASIQSRARPARAVCTTARSSEQGQEAMESPQAQMDITCLQKGHHKDTM